MTVCYINEVRLANVCYMMHLGKLYAITVIRLHYVVEWLEGILLFDINIIKCKHQDFFSFIKNLHFVHHLHLYYLALFGTAIWRD